MPLTREQRRALPDDDFAVPSKRVLPIVDDRHCRMAWSSILQAAGLTDAEREEGRKRISERAATFGTTLQAAQDPGLYVRRNLTAESAAEFVEWAVSQGFLKPMPAAELHVTIIHSRVSVTLPVLTDELRIVGGDRDVVPLGDDGALALRFQSDELEDRWEAARAAGATTTFEHFMPHVTIGWGGEPADFLDDVEPFRGDLVFGPEIHEPINAQWAEEKGLRMEAVGSIRLDGESLEAMALDMPIVDGHPNRMPFSGVLTHLDVASDRPPGGSKGRRVILTSKAAERALPSLLGMAVDFTPSFDDHDRTRKIGVITGARIEDKAIKIDGFIYARDFPAEASRIQTDKALLGFSWELAEIYVERLDADPLVITDAFFTGAAILRKDKAAYQSTSLAASAEDHDMTKEEIAAAVGDAVGAAMKPLNEALASMAAAQATALESITTMQAAADKAKAEAEDKAKADAAGAELAALQTKVADLEAAAAKNTKEPERKTLSAPIAALLAKADLSLPNGTDKLALGSVDQALNKAGLQPVERMRVKNELQRVGALG